MSNSVVWKFYTESFGFFSLVFNNPASSVSLSFCFSIFTFKKFSCMKSFSTLFLSLWFDSFGEKALKFVLVFLSNFWRGKLSRLMVRERIFVELEEWTCFLVFCSQPWVSEETVLIDFYLQNSLFRLYSLVLAIIFFFFFFFFVIKLNKFFYFFSLTWISIWFYKSL